jgi:carbonic anhydrase/acetyltransferase-like protein (isoleucine patch superfamily)
MIMSRNGFIPNVRSTSVVAHSAQIIGNVAIGERCYIDYNVVIESGGPPITIGDETIILANSVVRSVGGTSRPPFPVRIGNRTLISPLCALAGCTVGSNCYIATAVLIFQGAMIGDNSRVAAGAIVHLKTELPAETRVGLRHVAAPTQDGYVVTADIRQARDAIAGADFFRTVFEESSRDPRLHSAVIDRLLQEVLSWNDLPA